MIYTNYYCEYCNQLPSIEIYNRISRACNRVNVVKYINHMLNHMDDGPVKHIDIITIKDISKIKFRTKIYKFYKTTYYLLTVYFNRKIRVPRSITQRYDSNDSSPYKLYSIYRFQLRR